jgi:hypothetical protein
MMNVNSLENLTRIRGFIQYIGNPFIEAFAACLGRCSDSGMNAGWNAQGQLAGVRFVRLISKLGAGCNIIINRLFEGCFQLIDGLAVEGDNISNTRQAATETRSFALR